MGGTAASPRAPEDASGAPEPAAPEAASDGASFTTCSVCGGVSVGGSDGVVTADLGGDGYLAPAAPGASHFCLLAGGIAAAAPIL